MSRRSENSGLIDLDALMREAAARETAGDSPTRLRPVEPAPTPPSPTVRAEADDSLEAVTREPRTDPWIVAARPSAPPTEPSPGADRPPRARRRAIGLALVVALLAGGATFFRTQPTAVAPQVAITAGVPAPPRAPAAVAAEPTTGVTLSANDLPIASPVAPASASARSLHASPPARPDERAKPAATLSEAALPPSSNGGRGDLGDAMRGAVGASDQAAAVSNDGPSGPSASQLRPSPGAVVGALGSVLPAARACLGPDDPIRNGLIVFKSDGTVARVDLRGSKPEDDCVRSALSKAKVAPFVDETFATRVTVRP
ncbi:MAG TPA: hypothetical protein VM925_15880 [Labilithrix sp.]|nr:hypothetical protein [Labilithrix sp.]